MERQLNNKSEPSLWRGLFLLTTALMILQVLAIALILPQHAGNREILRLAASGLGYWSVSKEILFFVFAQLFLYFSVAGIIYFVANRICFLFDMDYQTQYRLGIFLWVGLVVLIYCGNTIYFPHSFFAFLPITADEGWVKIVATILLALWMIASITAVVGHTVYLWGAPLRIRVCTAIICVAVLGHFYYDFWTLHRGGEYIGKDKSPDVIFIGFDALRPDYLKQRQGRGNITPNFDAFLAQSVEFTDTLTTQARSFASFASILTGETPNQNGAQFKLVKVADVDEEASIAKFLQSHGYLTIYAVDKRRSNNIDETFGFDEIVGPKVGFNDFLLGVINDFPLSNFIVNTHLGEFLFPYSFANRAAAVTYYPDTFIRWLEKVLAGPRTKPVFLSFQMSLPHPPYFWAGQQPRGSAPDNPVSYYTAAVAEQDYQFGELLNILKKYHYLDHSVVVLVSDHGEALNQPGESFTIAKKFIAGSPRPSLLPQLKLPETRSGHGDDVLTMTNLKALLAFRFFGLSEANPVGELSFPTSIVDIKPTVLDILKYPSTRATDTGISLLPVMRSPNKADANRVRYVESGVETSDLSIEYYKIERETGRLIVNMEKDLALLGHKHRAIMSGNWYLVVLPPDKDNDKPRAILWNKVSGEWTDNLSSEFAQSAPLASMLELLKLHYGNEVQLNFPELS